MIIQCENCNKKFEIQDSLIPDEGRLLECGSCAHHWHYRPITKLEFSTKELAIEYAKKNKIKFELIESQERKIVKKSYADNFTK